jgi:Tol biopolymer transport system component
MLDVSDPLKPSIVCRIDPAGGAHILSNTRLAFWTGNEIGTADLASGAIMQTGRLAARADRGAFSPDGTMFAYRSYDAAGGMSTHLFAGGSDRVLYVEEPVGGHGGPGPSFGPFDQLEFSPDGSLLLDFKSFRPQTGPGNFLVFRSSDGSYLFRSTGATNGTWSPGGNTLYFLLGQAGQVGELESLSPDGQRKVVAPGVNGLYWPQMSPDGRSIVYNASDNSVRDCGGVPHLWRLDLASGHATQVSRAISSGPFFVQPTVVWSDEQQPSPCGPGGPSSPDGVILAHDLNTGTDSKVDTSLILPASGGPASTFSLLDTWFAPT